MATSEILLKVKLPCSHLLLFLFSLVLEVPMYPPPSPPPSLLTPPPLSTWTIQDSVLSHHYGSNHLSLSNLKSKPPA